MPTDNSRHNCCSAALLPLILHTETVWHRAPFPQTQQFNAYCDKILLMAATDLERDVRAANVLSSFLAKRDLPEITAQRVDLIVVCGSSVLATV